MTKRHILCFGNCVSTLVSKSHMSNVEVKREKSGTEEKKKKKKKDISNLYPFP